MDEHLAKRTAPTAIATAPRPRRRARLVEADAIPVRDVEIVTAEEKRHEEQVKKRAPIPTTSFTPTPDAAPATVVGVVVDSDVLFGFLCAAVEHVASPGQEAVKISYEPEDDRVVLESATASLWTAVAIHVKAPQPVGFTATVPVRYARNAANAPSHGMADVTIGVGEGGLWIGRHRMPQSVEPQDLISRPLLRPCEARALVPAAYFQEICVRILTAASKDPTRTGLHGVFLDFTVTNDQVVRCTAVSSDGARLHMLELPQMQVQPRARAVPPSIMIGERFFRYLRSVANREWTAVEISETQVSARGADYQVVAEAAMRGSTTSPGLEDWRRHDVEHRGHWAIDRLDIETLLRRIVSGESDSRIELHVDASDEELAIISIDANGRRVRDRLAARRFDGPAAANVSIDAGFLLDAVVACKSGLIRLGLAQPRDQATAPIIVRGDGDNFKAIIKPIG